MPATVKQPNRRIYLTPSELRAALSVCGPVRQTVFIHGPVGTAKSANVEQFAHVYGLTDQLAQAATYDPTDVNGIQIPVGLDTANPRVIWSQPYLVTQAYALAAQHPDRPHVVFVDEFNRAPMSVQNVCMRMLLNNECGVHPMPANCWYVVAVNDAQHSTGVQPMSEATKTRGVHLFVTADTASTKDFLAWGTGDLSLEPAAQPLTLRPRYADTATGRLRPEVIGYLSDHPEHAHYEAALNAGQLAPEAIRNADVLTTYRGWEFVSECLDASQPEKVEQALIYGAIGPEIGQQFWAFLMTFRSVGQRYRIPDLLAAPATYHIPGPTEVGDTYALASGLSRKLDAFTPTQQAAAIVYLCRLPLDAQTYAILGALRRTGTRARGYEDSPLHSVPGVGPWLVRHNDILA